MGLAPSSATSKVRGWGERSSNPSMVAAAVNEVMAWKKLAFMAGRSPRGGLDFAIQCAPDEFCQAQFLAARPFGQPFLGLSRQAERHRDTALGQLRSGHATICIIVSYTLSRPNSLAVSSCLRHGRRRAGQRIHGDHDHSSSCPRPGASGVGRSKTLREQVGRDPGGALQGGGHEDHASPERKDG